jgi:hypothetical protein
MLQSSAETNEEGSSSYVQRDMYAIRVSVDKELRQELVVESLWKWAQKGVSQ